MYLNDYWGRLRLGHFCVTLNNLVTTSRLRMSLMLNDLEGRP